MKAQSYAQDIVLHYFVLPSNLPLSFIEIEKKSFEG